jgi:hypothetical protein
MTRLSHRTTCISVLSRNLNHFKTFIFFLGMVSLVRVAAAATPAPTVTTLAISATSVPYQTPITLTATVTSGNSPVSAGLVLFCEATATYCENNSALGVAQLTFPGATASLKLGSGPLGNHSYKAVFRANSLYASSVSNVVTYAVSGTYSSTTGLTSSGTIGDYSLDATVVGSSSLSTGPTGSISFLDTSTGGSLLGTENLTVSSLSTTFVPLSPFPIGISTTRRSIAIASAYLDADNNLDVVTADEPTSSSDLSTISVLFGQGDGTFKPRVTYPGCNAGQSALQIILADFNRDGSTDVALACTDKNSSGGLVIILSRGDGTFYPPVYYSTGDAESIAIGDFNRDGILDIALTDSSVSKTKAEGNVVFFTGKGDGTFVQQATELTTPGFAYQIVAADFNGDGFDDVAYSVAETSPSLYSDLYVSFGDGNGNFTDPTVPIVTQIGEFLTAGDTNGDNRVDIVSSSDLQPDNQQNIGYSLFVLLGNGNGTFQPTVTYLSDIPSDPHLADVNGDGISDIIAGGSYGALVYQGNGDGTFQPYQEPAIADFSLTFAVNAGDFNNDGNADLIGTDANSPSAAVSLSQVTQTSSASALTSVAVFPLGSGVHQVDASYSGDSVYIGSVSPTVPLTAAPVNTTITLTASPTSATLAGEPVLLTAVLSPYTVGPPTTTTDNDTVNFYSGSTLLGSSKLTSGVATLNTTSLPVGADSVTAAFVGDSNYNPSTSNTVSATVSNILISSSLNPSTYTQSVVFTATLLPGKTGTVTFFDGSKSIGAGTISNAIATLTTSTLAAGTHNITAQYNSESSAILAQVVNKATPTVNVNTSGPSIYGAPVTITATVPSDATGTITFTSGTLSLGSGTIVSGSVSIITSVLTVPTDTITATYSGDGNYNTAAGSTIQTVSKASPASTLTSSANPSFVGSSVTFTDTLPTNVTGTVTFASGSTALGSSPVVNGIATVSTAILPVGSDPVTATYGGDPNDNTSIAGLTQGVNKTTPVVTVTTSGPSTYGQLVTITASVPAGPTGTITISGGGATLGSGLITSTNGTVTITTTSLPVGNDTITANYGGDAANNLASGSVIQVVSKATPVVTLVSSLNPSAFNQSVTFTASVPTGVSGSMTFTSGSTNLGTLTLTGGTASVSTGSLPVGGDTVAATYNGDLNNSTATASLTQNVSKITPVVTVTTSGPANYGASVTITSSVPSGTTGTITITSGGVTLGSGSVSSTNETVVITTTVLPVGTDSITASYGGDANNNQATGSTTDTISKASPSETVVSSLNPSTFGQSVTFTATLPLNVTGTVSFMYGSINLGTSNITNGTAVVSTSTLSVGPDTIIAAYSGDTNNNSATASVIQSVGKATPPITVTTSGNSTYGNPVTITTTLPSGTTGTVTITSGGITLGAGSVNPTTGTFTITTSTLPVGTDQINANYGGDANNNPVMGSTSQVVGKATPVVTLISSLNPSALNQSVTFTASLPTGVTGSVTFISGSTNLGTATLSGGTATVTTSSLPVGGNNIVATYNGDANNSNASASLIQNVSKTTPIVTVTTSGSTTVGGTVTITATVPPGTTGTITINGGGGTLGSGTVNPTTGTVTITTTSLPVGSDPITASYGGDTNNNPANGSTTVTITKASPVETLVSSLNPSSPGQSVTFTATLPSAVTGSVTFTNGATVLGVSTITSGTATIATSTLPSGSDNIVASYSGDSNYNTATASLVQTVSKGTPIVTVTTSGSSTYGGTVTITASVPPGTTGTITISSGGVKLGSGTVNPVTGTVTITTTSLPVGSDPIIAAYGGDSNNNPATGTTTQIVTKASPTITLASSLNPSIVGQSVTFVATMSTNATGTITFFDGTTSIGSATLGNGQASIQSSTLAVGSHIITASYGGDVNDGTATSGPLTQVVNKATPVLPPPTVSSSSPPINTPVTITETVPPGVTGTVTFYNGTTPIGTATIVGGVATITVPSLPLGTDPITASTSGDANNNPATSPATVVTVGKAVPVITLTSSANPSPSNVLITFTASTHVGATGVVTFLDGSTILGTATINTAGVATFATSTLTIGSHPITASYGGDSNYSSVVSSVLTQVISKISTVITITESTPAQLIQTGVTFTATVTAPSPNATGTVTFLDGTTILGTATLTSSGTVGISLTTNANAALLTSTLAVGSHQITAVYSGDSTFASSTSAPANNNVEDFTNTNTGSASQNIFPGATTSYKFSLAPIGATTFLNDLNVSVAGLPAGSTYTFTPSVITAGSGATTVVLNVQTSNSLSARNQVPQDRRSLPRELPIATGMLGLVGLGVTRKLRHKIPRALMLLLLAVGSLLPIAVLSGCAGGYFTLTPTTYSVTVTGVEGSVQHAATATLIVQ